MREMVDDYSRQVELRDNTIRHLQNSEAARQQEISMLVYKENETLKHESKMLRDKVQILEEEIHHMAQNDPRPLHAEIDRLNRILSEKEVQYNREMADQKNEWAEIYGAQKQQFEKQQREIQILQSENQRLNEQGKPESGLSKKSTTMLNSELQEALKRLKKRELECQALWDTLKDLKSANEKTFDLS